jgi:hypothetical protein
MITTLNGRCANSGAVRIRKLLLPGQLAPGAMRPMPPAPPENSTTVATASSRQTANQGSCTPGRTSTL